MLSFGWICAPGGETRKRSPGHRRGRSPKGQGKANHYGHTRYCHGRRHRRHRRGHAPRGIQGNGHHRATGAHLRSQPGHLNPGWVLHPTPAKTPGQSTQHQRGEAPTPTTPTPCVHPQETRWIRAPRLAWHATRWRKPPSRPEQSPFRHCTMAIPSGRSAPAPEHAKGQDPQPGLSRRNGRVEVPGGLINGIPMSEATCNRRPGNLSRRPSTSAATQRRSPSRPPCFPPSPPHDPKDPVPAVPRSE